MQGQFFKRQAVLLAKLQFYPAGCHISELARISKTTYSHAYDIIKKCTDAGLIIVEKKSRKNIIILTEKGKQVAEYLNKLERLLS
jgi:predicted transcriptional regulator